jgi:chemotaxis regulatin CheY-phosphate phosphatase CheZ
MSKEELTEILSDWKAWDGSIVDTPPSSNGVKEEKGEFDLNAWLSTNIERDDVNPLTARINEFLDSIDGPPPVADLIRSVTLPVTEMILDLVAVHGVEKTQDWLAEQLATQRAAQAVADVRDLLREFGNNGTSEHQKVVIKLLTVLDNTYDTVLSSQSTT